MDASNRNLDLYLRARNATVTTETQIKQPWPYTGGYWDPDDAYNNDGSENDAANCDILTNISYSTLQARLIPDGPLLFKTLSWPTRFEAIHMNLIPVGPNRGKVMTWNGDLVVGTLGSGFWKDGEEWVFQPWTIVNPTAGATPRHLNFLLPMAPRERIGPASATFTGGSATITFGAAHGYVTGDTVCVSSSGTMPTPFTINTNYTVLYVSATEIQLTLLGAVVTCTNAGSGTRRVTKDYYHSLFCAAQAWNHRGHLVVGGGCRFEISKGWTHNVYPHTWIFDPTQLAEYQYSAGGPNPWTGSYANLIAWPMTNSGTPNHYSSNYGRWIQGPDLDVTRYYPTVALTAPMGAGRATHANKTCMLVVGGDDNPSTTDGVTTIPGTYESLVQDAAPTYAAFPGFGSNSGMVKEQYAGVYSWDGPSDWDPVTNPFPDGHPFRDGLYFYPHMHLLADGRMFMSGFVPASSTLDHETAPGTWTKTEGHDDQPGLINAFRYYSTSVHWIDASGADIVWRMGGGQLPIVEVPDKPVLTLVSVASSTITGVSSAVGGEHNFQTGDAVKVSNSGGSLPGGLTSTTTYYAIRVDAASLKLAASYADALVGTFVVLGGTGTGTTRVYADLQSGFYGPQFPGYRPTAFPELPLDTRSVDAITPSTPGSQWTVGPAMQRARSLMNVVWLADGARLAVGGVDVDESAVADSPPAIHPLLMDMTVPGEEHDHPDTGVSANGFVYQLAPEIFRWGGNRWEALDWAPAQSIRDYHSTAVLLPDARVLCGGSTNRTLDYEVFEPPYLRPSSDYPDIAVTRPTSVALASPSPTGDGTYELTYGTSYTLNCAALPEGIRLERATIVSPGAATHHQDWSQQFADLAVSAGSTPNSITITMPANNKRFRPGYAMLFAITSLGVPSNAIWIKLPHP
jgi:hypothetical protein